MRIRPSLLALSATLLLTAAACGDENDNGPLYTGANNATGDGDDADDGGDGDDDRGDGDGDRGNTGDGDDDEGTKGDGDGDSGDGDSGDGDSGDGDGDNPSTFPPVTDFAAAGPFPTTTGPNPTDCTIHRPTTLGEGGRKHPVILWGNGTGTSPAIYGGVLKHWATHGFIVAAANTSNAGSGKEMLACLDYLEEQNDGSGNPYAGHVDLAHVGTSGHSQGGGGSIMAGADPRVSVTAPLQPYIGFIPGGGTFSNSSIKAQQGPMFLMSGENDTIARPDAQQKPVYDAITQPVFWGTLKGATHTGTAIGNINGYRGPSTAWFRLHLMNDDSARDMFYGASCGLCEDTTWMVMTKGL